MGVTEIALAAAALLIGATGTWSPCGFSMIETLGPGGHTGGRRTTLAACATFLPGAVAGGVVTFCALALLGGLVHGVGGRVAYIAAAAIAVAAAIAELRGAPIAPQLRRQLPEHWRRTMPMPVAAALYGVLLGLGFTTFVLSFGVWALAGISVAVGEPQAGLAIGVAFGIGRAIPICALAPIADRPSGRRVTETMAMRPAIYRGFRFGDALALLAAAAALTATGVADAAKPVARPGADPSTEGAELVYSLPGGAGVLVRDGQQIELPGRHPTLGDGYLATLEGDAIQLRDAATLAPLGSTSVEGVDALAVSGSWLAYRKRRKGRDTIEALRISDVLATGEVSRRRSSGSTAAARKRVASAKSPTQLGRPALDGGLLAYAVAKRRGNRIVRRGLDSGKRGVVVGSRSAALQSPSLHGNRLAYVRIERRRQWLQLRSVRSRSSGSTLLSRRRARGILWSTALSADRAYVTLLQGKRAGRAKVLSVPR